MNKRAQAAIAVILVSFGGLYLWKSRRPTPPPIAEADVQPAGTTPSNDVSASPNATHHVDIVFAIDTTGSMGGLIGGAKQKIWEIARRAQEGKPAPQLRVGLVAYRDQGDAYVTRVLDLTGNLDEVYATLSGFTAEGGGDGPEHVLKGLDDAIHAEHWSPDPDAIKLVYLVGDAPPHLDYHDGLTLDGVLGDASRAGIRISAIRCGTDPATLASWTQIAQRTDGEVSTIEQTGGVAVITTPFDAELARLNADLTKTEVRWGSAAERGAAAEVAARNVAAPREAQADRVSFYRSAAAAKAGPMKKDLAATAASAMPLAAVAPTDLPDEMQAMSGEERARYLEGKRAERTAILEQVRVASAKREEYLRTKSPAPAASSFDGKVYDSLRKAGAKKGMVF